MTIDTVLTGRQVLESLLSLVKSVLTITITTRLRNAQSRVSHSVGKVVLRMEFSERYRMAMRRFHARQRLPLMLADLAKRLHRDVSTFATIPVEQADPIIACYWERLRACEDCLSFCLLPRQNERFAECLKRVSPRAANMELLLFRAIDCGAVRMSGDELLSHVLDLIDPDQEDLTACTEDVSEGIFLRASTESQRGEELIVLSCTSWGARLSGALQEALEICKNGS